MTQTFIDTIVVCSFTGIAIIASGVWRTGVDGAPLTQAAFDSALPFSTILGWSYYGSQSVAYLFGRRAVLPYRLLFVIAAFAGSLYSLQFVWLFSDVMNGLMALPNLVGLLLLSGVAVRETRDYRERMRSAGILQTVGDTVDGQ